MSRFMERRRKNDQAEYDEKEHRLVEQMAETLRDAMHEKQPPVKGDEAGQRPQDDQWPEEWPEYCGDRVDQPGGNDGRLEVQRE